jgi:phosphatidylserine/phosphatidylglycerophosphate/cardiolipin synthase-like enzyme
MDFGLAPEAALAMLPPGSPKGRGKMTLINWLLAATGFTGAWTLLFLGHLLKRLVAGPAPSVEVFFSPKGGCTEAVVREISAARHEVLVQAYSCSSKPIAEALIAAKTRGVQVMILLDKSNEAESYSDLPLFVEQGLAPLIDAQHAIAHNKVMVIDRKTILTGSFNFTHQAEAENAENLLVIKGHTALAKAYHERFAEHKGHCQQPQAKTAHAAKAAA